MDYGTYNFVLDFVLIVASLWMLFTVRGLGGVVGQSFNLIIAGVVVLGVAHLVATLLPQVMGWDSSFGALNQFIHRLIVLLGFALTAFGFQQVRKLTN
jgi:hypothetical protein